MKKTYMTPETKVWVIATEEMISSSIVGTNDTLSFGGDDEEGLSGDVKGSLFDENPWE